MLIEVCNVDAELAAATDADVPSCTWSFVALPDLVRHVVMTPFIEEVFDHDPPDTALELKAAVTVVVRNSPLEEAHANAPVEAGGIQAITKAACAPPPHLLARRPHWLIAGRVGRLTSGN
jgi:hypothetical protein